MDVESLAGVTRRVLAWVLDVVVVAALIFVAVGVVDEILEPTVSVHPDAATLEDVLSADEGRVAVNAVLAAGLSACYFVVPWALVGGSPAQLALRMRVRGSRSDVSLTVGRALVRWILLFPPFATVSALSAGVPYVGALAWGIAVVWYLVLLVTTARSDTKQGLHDRLAGSVVLASRPATAHGGVGVR
jgi:hypothetical protein